MQPVDPQASGLARSTETEAPHPPLFSAGGLRSFFFTLVYLETNGRCLIYPKQN